jgi:hypothetical protein
MDLSSPTAVSLNEKKAKCTAGRIRTKAEGFKRDRPADRKDPGGARAFCTARIAFLTANRRSSDSPSRSS